MPSALKKAKSAIKKAESATLSTTVTWS